MVEMRMARRRCGGLERALEFRLGTHERERQCRAVGVVRPGGSPIETVGNIDARRIAAITAPELDVYRVTVIEFAYVVRSEVGRADILEPIRSTARPRSS